MGALKSRGAATPLQTMRYLLSCEIFPKIHKKYHRLEEPNPAGKQGVKVNNKDTRTTPYYPTFGLNTERYSISPYSVRMRDNMASFCFFEHISYFVLVFLLLTLTR